MRNARFLPAVPTGLIVPPLLMLALGGCISVKTPEKPIEINLNVVIRQEVVVKLQRDVENLIQSNPGAFPGTTAVAPPKPR